MRRGLGPTVLDDGQQDPVTSAYTQDDTIVNADVNSAAAIAGTKISPDFGAQNVVTTGSVGIGTTGPSYKLHVAGDVGATAFFYTSDARLKYDMQPAKGLDIIGKLNGVSFTWKDTDKRSAGLIAQDVEKVLPEAVSTDSSTGMKSLNYGALAAPIVESIKELDKNSKEKDEKISELQNEIEILKKEIEKLKI